MNNSQRAEASKHEIGVDFISNMPDPILHLILQGLPTTEEVVRTSILSTRWRYLWTHIPSIDLDVSRGPENAEQPQEEIFKDFVSWVLEKKTVGLDSFRLNCLNYYMPETIWQWVDAAVVRKVKRLDLTFFTRLSGPDITLPHFDSLESLRLDFYQRSYLAYPDDTSFPALRCLELNNLFVENLDVVERLSKMCPLLEELSLIDCFIRCFRIYDTLCISCPKLKTLRIHKQTHDAHGSGISNFCIKVSCPELLLLELVGLEVKDHSILLNVDCLKKVLILPQFMLQGKVPSQLGDTIWELVAGISHVESLSLNLFIFRRLDAVGDLIRTLPASLPNLKKLEITTTTDAFTLNIIIQIIRCCPILESLHLIIEEESSRALEWALDEVESRETLTRHLKRAEFCEFDGGKRKLVMACWLLKYANALEEMVFNWCNEVMYFEKSRETMNQVLKVNKASSTVKLFSSF